MQDTSSPSSASVATTVTSSSSLPSAKKIVIAVHGIGDQYRNATIQSVVASFGQFEDYTATMPLGRLGTEDGKSTFFLKGPPPPKDPLDKIGFVELYWADIPRKIQTEGYHIEETKAWARTVVERLRARYNYFREEARKLGTWAPGKGDSDLPVELHREDFSAAADAIEEMIETFAVLDHLLLVFEKLGLLKFNLNELLTGYVGDVQVVADFPDQRRAILDKFRAVLDQVSALNDKAEIYLVAHSEGTVVAFLGLLEAMAGQPRANGQPTTDPPKWVAQVRGLMTIGSPIDKHLILWPDIWDDLQTPHPELKEMLKQAGGKIREIKWRNYYDYGDPVGFRLDTTRDWLRDHHWKQFFEFESNDDNGKRGNKEKPNHDYGFSRYLFPGAAHIDYWGDEDVFGHFIETVVLPQAKTRGYSKPPRTKPLQRIGSLVIPYALVYVLIFAGVYLLYKGTVEYLFPLNRVPEPNPTIRHFGGNVAGVSALMMGMLALARIPRLTRRWTMWAVALGAFALGAALYWYLVEPAVKTWQVMNKFHSPSDAGAFVIAVAFLVVGLSSVASRRKLWNWRWLAPILGGTRGLMILAALCVFVPIGYHVITDTTDANHQPPLWPLLLASAAFFYLWWLAILIFDLVFVWHRYIRSAVSQKYLRKLRSKAKGTDHGAVAKEKTSATVASA
jgi:hypothetical protein